MGCWYMLSEYPEPGFSPGSVPIIPLKIKILPYDLLGGLRRLRCNYRFPLPVFVLSSLPALILARGHRPAQEKWPSVGKRSTLATYILAVGNRNLRFSQYED